MAAFFPPLLFPAERRILFDRALNWAPGVLSIAVAVAVALAIRMAAGEVWKASHVCPHGPRRSN